MVPRLHVAQPSGALAPVCEQHKPTPFQLSTLFVLVVLVSLIADGRHASAQTRPVRQEVTTVAAPSPVIVRNDRGGLIRRRASEIAVLRQQGTPVEIAGDICLSSCTMFLGLETTCIHPKTTFGFHGPSNYGAPLSENDFLYWSQLMAAHYPQPLRDWFMREGRFRGSNYFRISGRQLIRLGLRQCPEAL